MATDGAVQSRKIGIPAVRPDIFELESFYAAPLGRRVAAVLRQTVTRLLPDLRGRDGLALGYPLPLLPADNRFAVVMPHGQGARAQGPHGNRVVLAREEALPFPDRAFDCALLMHALEHAARPERLLREIWRVLADGGLLVVVVPNRHGLWSLGEHTPFGHGRPFTAGALRALLRAQLFEPCGEERALFWPPLGRGLPRRLAALVERAGRAVLGELSGLVLVAAEKRVLLAPTVPAELRRGAYVRLPVALAGPHARAGEPPAASTKAPRR